MTRPRMQLPFVLLALLVAGTAAADLDARDSLRLSLLKLKGHLGVARSLIQVRADGASYHLQMPMRDIFSDIAPELEARGAPLSADTLDELERVTLARPQAALATIDLAAAAIDGSFAQTGAVDSDSALELSGALLRDAVALYERAVEDFEVVDVRRYRAGRGYTIQAEALIRHAGDLPRRERHDELVASVILVRQAWPSVVPPPIVFGVDDVRNKLEDALAMMDELR